MNNEELILEKIISTPDGSGLATKGKELEQKWNANANLTAKHINALWLALSECVTSGNIVAIRINSSTGKAEYTFDPVDGTEEWHLLASIEWSDILGNPMASTSLAAVLNSKASVTALEDLGTVVQALSNTVESNSANIINQIGVTNNHEERITGLEADTNTIYQELENTVHAKPGDFLTLMWNHDTNNVDFSVDGGTNWKPIMSSINWKDLVGQPTSNIEFSTYISELIGPMLSDVNFQSVTESVRSWLNELEVIINEQLALKANNEDLERHINDINNPHNVTKEQVGLGSVENLSPYDMPISNATMEAINAIQAKDVGFVGLSDFEVISRLDYDNLNTTGELNSTALYLVSRLNIVQATNVSYASSSVIISSPGTGYTDGDTVYYVLSENTLYLKLEVVDGLVTGFEVLSQGQSNENFAGMGIPLEGGTGTGLTVDIETVQIKND